MLVAVSTFLIIVTVSNASHFVLPNKNTVLFIEKLLEENHIHFVNIITCRTYEYIDVMKHLMRTGVRTKLQEVQEMGNMADLLAVKNHMLAVILDWSCDGALRFLTQASEKKMLSPLHYWLILTGHDEKNDDTNSTSSRDMGISMHEDLEQLNVPIDSQVVLAHVHEGGVLLQDVYRIKPELPLIITSLREWSLGHSIPSGPRRDNYGGMIFPTSTVVIGGTWENFLDMRYRHINSLTKFHYVLVEHLARMLNFKTNCTPVNTWGYPINGTKNYDGVIGFLQRGEIEIASVAVVFKIQRLQVLEYVGETVLYEGAFMFLKPSLSDVSNIYTLPFSLSVWMTYLVVLVIFAIVFYITQTIEDRMGDKTKAPITMSDSALTAIAIVCSEGSSRDPKNMSARIIFMSLLMLSLFLTTSYSAIIVSLLQTTSSAINSLKELMDSPFKLGMKDVISNIRYVNETTDKTIQDLYFKHIFTQPYHKAFTSTEVGVERMRTQLYAFHGDADALRAISNTYEEYEKCRLKQIKMFTSLQLSMVAKKGTNFKEHFRRTARWLKEAGLVDREYKVWLAQKPKCHATVEGFVSVRLQDFYPALLVWIHGVSFSVLVLLGEFLYRKLKRLGTVVSKWRDSSEPQRFEQGN